MTQVSCVYPTDRLVHPEWPAIGAGEQDPWLDPFANAIGSLESISSTHGEEAVVGKISLGWVRSGSVGFAPVGVVRDTALHSYSNEVWEEARTELENGELLVGLSSAAPDGGMNVSWILNEQGHFVGGSAYEQRGTAMLDFFLAHYAEEDTPFGFMLDWNREDDVGGGASVDAWGRFLANELVIHAPAVGTKEWWGAVSTDCRSLADAPASVLEDRTTRNIVFTLPEAWTRLDDLAICASTDVGSLGCAEVAGQPHVLLGASPIASDETVNLKLAQVTDGSVGFDRMIAIGNISAGSFGEGRWLEVVVISDLEPGDFEQFVGAESPGLESHAIDESTADRLLAPQAS